MNLHLFGHGFVGGRYASLYPDNLVIEPRTPRHEDLYDDALWLIGTTSNYAPLAGDLQTDIDTNLKLPMRTIPRVKGTFNLVSSWFVCAEAGMRTEHPAREDDPCDPNGFYSVTALAREKLVRSYRQTINRPYRILRLCNVIGNDPRAGKQKNALEMMLGKVKRGQDVEVYTGDNYRAVMHVDDVCRAIHLCLESAPLNEIVHIGPPRSVRIIDLVNHAIAVTKSPSRVTLVPPPRFHQIVQVPDFHFDTTKLRGLGFVPDMDPYEAVERTLANL